LWKEEHLRKTIAPLGEEVTTCSIDLRVGGAYHYVFVTDEGTECSLRGTFQIDRPNQTVQTWVYEGWPAVEDVESMDLHEAAGTTTLTSTLWLHDEPGRNHMTKYDGIEANFEIMAKYVQSLTGNAAV
jgi:uncharacterized protein YndB with AHSA1/START domain